MVPNHTYLQTNMDTKNPSSWEVIPLPKHDFYGPAVSIWGCTREKTQNWHTLQHVSARARPRRSGLNVGCAAEVKKSRKIKLIVTLAFCHGPPNYPHQTYGVISHHVAWFGLNEPLFLVGVVLMEVVWRAFWHTPWWLLPNFLVQTKPIWGS